MRIIRSALAGRAVFQPVEHKCIHIMFKSDIPIGTAVRLSYHFHDMRCRRFLCMASSCNHGCFVRPIRLSSVLYRFYAAHNAIPMLGGCFIYHDIMGCHQCSHVTMGSSRMMRDSNPRNLSVHLFSRQAPSTTRTIIQFVQQVQWYHMNWIHANRRVAIYHDYSCWTRILLYHMSACCQIRIWNFSTISLTVVCNRRASALLWAWLPPTPEGVGFLHRSP